MVNSAQAMRDGSGRIQVSGLVSAGRCRIDFADDGPGIPPDIREKIFTPFFTTKSRGSGLGLPTAKRLIEAHRGNIRIACPTAGGTIVTVELPAAGQQGIAAAGGPRSVESSAGGAAVLTSADWDFIETQSEFVD